MGRFDHKTALVTGAASGMGRAAALAFAREGANVCAVDLDADGLASLVAEAEGLPGELMTHQTTIGSARPATVRSTPRSSALAGSMFWPTWRACCARIGWPT